MAFRREDKGHSKWSRVSLEHKVNGNRKQKNKLKMYCIEGGIAELKEAAEQMEKKQEAKL